MSRAAAIAANRTVERRGALTAHAGTNSPRTTCDIPPQGTVANVVNASASTDENNALESYSRM